jgi:hypothetical protein
VNVKADSDFSCLRFDSAKSASERVSNFEKGGIRSKQGTIVNEKQVCLKDRNVVNEKLEQEDAERGSLGQTLLNRDEQGDGSMGPHSHGSGG